MQINKVNPNISFSAIVVKDSSNAMGVLSANYQFESKYLSERPIVDKNKPKLLDKFSKLWFKFLASKKENIVLSTNSDVYIPGCVKSIVADVEYVKNGKHTILGTVKEQENIYDFAKSLLKIQRKSLLKRIL